MRTEVAIKLLTDLGAEKIRVRETGDGDIEVTHCCLLHDDGRPSATLNPKKQIYFCSVCGGFSLLRFIKEFKGFANTYQAAKWLDSYDIEGLGDYSEGMAVELKDIPDWDQRYSQQEDLDLPESFFNYWGYDGGNTRGGRYLRRRIPDVVTRAELEIHYDPIKHRIIFPVRSIDKKIVGWSERWDFNPKNTDDGVVVLPRYVCKEIEENRLSFKDWEIKNPRWRHEYKKAKHLYGAHLIEPGTKRVIIVEGFTTLAWLRSHGFKNVVALGNSKISQYQADILMRLCDEVVDALDNDDAGRVGRLRTIARLGDFMPVYTVSWPAGFKDFDGHEPETIRRLLDTAVYYLKGKMVV